MAEALKALGRMRSSEEASTLQSTGSERGPTMVSPPVVMSTVMGSILSEEPGAVEPAARAHVASADARAWLQRTSVGYCHVTEFGDAGDCEAGDKGAFEWPIGVGGASGQRLRTLQRCLAHCAACARCNYISFSRKEKVRTSPS